MIDIHRMKLRKLVDKVIRTDDEFQKFLVSSDRFVTSEDPPYVLVAVPDSGHSIRTESPRQYETKAVVSISISVPLSQDIDAGEHADFGDYISAIYDKLDQAADRVRFLLENLEYNKDEWGFMWSVQPIDTKVSSFDRPSEGSLRCELQLQYEFVYHSRVPISPLVQGDVSELKTINLNLER